MTAQREWLEKDFYAVLGVSESASEKEITKAYRALARTHHPDQGGDESRFKEISAAYDVLGDPDKRKEYDELRRLGPMAGGFAAGGPGGGSYQVRFDDLSDFGGGLGDLFGNLFGRGAGGPGTRTTHSGPRPAAGADVETTLHVSFADAVAGVTTEVMVGAERVKVRLPAGVNHGQRIRLRGKGRPGRDGGPPGDLFVIVQVEDHRLFGRSGNDLTLRVPVTFGEATLGSKLTVPTLDGERVTLKLPAGTASGTTLRVRGRGVAYKGTTGDLLVTVEVAVPKHLTEAQEQAVLAMEDALDQAPREHLFEST